MSNLSIAEAIKLLSEENIIGIPTETVYGLAGIITSSNALKKIFTLKERPLFDPLIIHVSSIDMAKKYCNNFGKLAQKIAEKYWPGPLTLILQKNDKVNPLITANLSKVGIRIPNHQITLELISKINIPLAAPSANKFKKTSPTTVKHVQKFFGTDFPIIDGGDSQIGIESTVMEIDEKNNTCYIYRLGMITPQMIKIDFPDITIEIKESPVAPGQLNDHYMPDKKLFFIKNKKLINDYIHENNFNKDDFLEFALNKDPLIMMRELYSKLHNLKESTIPYHYFNLENYKDLEDNEIFQAIKEKLIKASSLQFMK
jgi:L-threonylcarbamoyladenylate synthase